MEKGRLIILEAEVNKQKEEIDKIYQKIIERGEDLDSEINIESLAYQLHNLYCSFEDLFKIITDTFENNIEEGVAWHKELLRRMAISIKGIRPFPISENSLNLLSELRAFRHFFRHAYAYKLDKEKIKFVLNKALELKEYFNADLCKFMADLKK